MENHPGYRQFVALRQIKIKLNNRFVALFGTKTGTCLACGLEIERAAAVTSLLRSTREDCQVNKQRYN